MPPRLRLKKATGWFAAGREVRTALSVLSAEAFRLYLYLCLNAERSTGRMAWQPEEIADVFRCAREVVSAALEELCAQLVCAPSGASALEICDRFWPYEKTTASLAPDRDSYVQQVRQMLLRRACVQASFSAADERLAAQFYQRGVPLIELQRAIWLGCARKYLALLNGQGPMFITSLHYFSGLVDEVVSAVVGESYWTHVQRKAEELEGRWLARHKIPPPRKPDEMTETK
jgi:hypothetical protein